MSTTTCPYCGELADTYPDLGGGERQEYVEDRTVCCRPIRFSVEYDHVNGVFKV